MILRILLLSILFLLCNITLADSLTLPVIRVIDGDTIETRLTLPHPLDVVKIRIYGIDTPEMPAKSYRTTGKLGRAQCNNEAEMALKAKAFVQQMIEQSGNTIIVENFSWDKYGGRIDGVVLINSGTTDLGEALVQAGYAVRYYGGTKVNPWCNLK